MVTALAANRREAHNADGMRPVLLRLRAELRSRSLSWLTLALIVGIVAGASIAAAAGARRTDTAYDRFVADRHSADVLVDNTPNPEIPIVDLTPATRLPQVAEFSTLKYFSINDDSANVFVAPDERALRDQGSQPAEDPPRPHVEPEAGRRSRGGLRARR